MEGKPYVAGGQDLGLEAFLAFISGATLQEMEDRPYGAGGQDLGFEAFWAFVWGAALQVMEDKTLWSWREGFGLRGLLGIYLGRCSTRDGEN